MRKIVLMWLYSLPIGLFWFVSVYFLHKTAVKKDTEACLYETVGYLVLKDSSLVRDTYLPMDACVIEELESCVPKLKPREKLRLLMWASRRYLSSPSVTAAISEIASRQKISSELRYCLEIECDNATLSSEQKSELSRFIDSL